MSVLSDSDMERMLASGELQVRGISDPLVQIQPSSIDLRLGKIFLRPKRHDEPVDPLNTTQLFDTVDASKGERSIVIHPREFLLGATVEHVTVPNDLLGRVDGRSSLGRHGLVIHVTAGFIDSGFSGNITLELFNAGVNSLRLTPGMRICQISFERLSSPVRRPYGPARGSKYLGSAADGPSGPQKELEGGPQFVR